MEDGDSDTDKYPHRTGNIAGYYQLHGTWAVLLLKQPLPCPSPKKRGAFWFLKGSQVTTSDFYSVEVN